MNTSIHKTAGVFLGIFLFCGAAKAADIAACGPLTSGGTYTLTADVSSSGTCFTIDGASGVTFDGNGRTITAQTAFLIQNHATSVTLENLIVSATYGVLFPSVLKSSCAGASADGVTIRNSHFLSGDIRSGVNGTVGTLCNLTLEDNTLDSGLLRIENYTYMPIPYTGLTARRNVFGGGIEVFYMNDVLIEDHNDIRSFIYFSHGNNLTIRDNSIVSSTWPADIGTHSILAVVGAKNSLFENNYVESKVVDVQPALWRFYELENSTLRNNYVTRDPAAAPSDPGDLAYGLIWFRSSCMNNHIVGNTLVNRKYGHGIYTHYSNECCNTEGVLYVPCNERAGNPEGWQENCSMRYNTYDGNTIIAPGYALDMGDGSDDSFGNMIRNNLFIGGVNSNSRASDANVFLNNTIDGKSGAAVVVAGGSQADAHNNIFRSSGSSSVSVNGTLTGDYNLLSPANASVLSAQPNSFTANPGFSDISDTDPLLRDYRLSVSSPAIDRADPATLTTWGINWDRDLGLRPLDDPGHANFNGSAFDIGAYEFGSTPNVAPTPTPPPHDGTPMPTPTPTPPDGDGSGTGGVSVKSGGCSVAGGTGWFFLALLTTFFSRPRTSRSCRSRR